ncbi:hypothetical protein U1Q18_025120 [Sarracenia purpurea var. burkii]
MDLPQPEDGGPSRVGNLTLIDKGFEKMAKEALNQSPRLEVSNDQVNHPSSPTVSLTMKVSLEATISLHLMASRSPTKLSEVFVEALGLEGEQGVDGDDEDAEEEIAIVELMIGAVEHDKAMVDQKLKNLLEARALSQSHVDKVGRSGEEGGLRIGRNDFRFGGRGGRNDFGPIAKVKTHYNQDVGNPSKPTRPGVSTTIEQNGGEETSAHGGTGLHRAFDKDPNINLMLLSSLNLILKG